jgi:cysteinyl-tRNA synthetase
VGVARPGRQTGCSAMMEATSKQFQPLHQVYFHAGSRDLCFPHHTNEIAPAEAYQYQNQMIEQTPVDSHCQHLHLQSNKWIPHWVHTGHLLKDGRKMSKTLKSFIAIQELLTMKQPDSFPNFALQQMIFDCGVRVVWVL